MLWPCSGTHHTCWPLLAKIPGYFFNEAGQLQKRAMFGSKPKLLIPQQPALAYFIKDPGKQDLLKQFANRFQQANGPIG
jgi:hypothetical protein